MTPLCPPRNPGPSRPHSTSYSSSSAPPPRPTSLNLHGTVPPYTLARPPAGDIVEVIDGVNAPALGKAIADHIPEGMLDIEDDKDEEGADEDGDDY